jgi:hypothetical protein
VRIGGTDFFIAAIPGWIELQQMPAVHQLAD